MLSSASKTNDPPLQLLNGQSPEVVSLEYCYTHKLDIPSYAHELNKELRSRVPEELKNSYPPLRKVMLVIPFETANGIQRTPFYETDIPAKFSENLLSLNLFNLCTLSSLPLAYIFM